jgi:hypothetical protein
MSRKTRALRVGWLGAAFGATALVCICVSIAACSSGKLQLREGASDGAGGAVVSGLPGPAGGPTTATDERVFAVDTILLGDTDRQGNADRDAWKTYGYDLDHLDTQVADDNAPDLAHVCKRTANAPATIHQDGTGGIDNAFGKEVLPLLQLVLTAPTQTVTSSIHAGTFTILLELVGLTDDPAQTNTGLGGKLVVGGIYGGAPTFDRATDWPTVPGSEDPIASAYINQGIFVNGQGGATVHLNLHVGGQLLPLTIRSAIFSFKHDPAGNALAEGTIAGVINTEDFVANVSNTAGAVDPAFCSPGTKDTLINAIREASDMLSDGTQDPNKTCDAISIGLGFTAKRVGVPDKQAAPTPATGDPCTTPRDAGKGG